MTKFDAMIMLIKMHAEVLDTPIRAFCLRDRLNKEKSAPYLLRWGCLSRECAGTVSMFFE